MRRDEERLAGGNISTVVRVGDTVRRPSGPWTEIVHSLLRHIRNRGFDLAPEPLGIDEHGREILRYIDGSSVGGDHPWPGWAWTDDLLIQATSALRRYHDAVSDFRPVEPLLSRLGESTLGPGDIVCHNDFAPYNVVFRDGLAGVIDWDIISSSSTGMGPGIPRVAVGPASQRTAGTRTWSATRSRETPQAGAPLQDVRRLRA
jgi:hypothetical protein